MSFGEEPSKREHHCEDHITCCTVHKIERYCSAQASFCDTISSRETVSCGCYKRKRKHLEYFRVNLQSKAEAQSKVCDSLAADRSQQEWLCCTALMRQARVGLQISKRNGQRKLTHQEVVGDHFSASTPPAFCWARAPLISTWKCHHQWFLTDSCLPTALKSIDSSSPATHSVEPQLLGNTIVSLHSSTLNIPDHIHNVGNAVANRERDFRALLALVWEVYISIVKLKKLLFLSSNDCGSDFAITNPIKEKCDELTVIFPMHICSLSSWT